MPFASFTVQKVRAEFRGHRGHIAVHWNEMNRAGD